MYGRQVNERELRFGHEGKLYQDSFIMYDRQTQTQWVHTTGVGIKGPMRGAQLQFLPSEVVAWQVWRERYPHTTVIDRGDMDTGFMGQFTLPERASEFGLSVGSGRDVVLYPMETLMAQALLQDDWYVVVYDAKTQTVRAFARGEQSFAWHASGTLIDERGTHWDPVTGEAFAEGEGALRRVPATAWLTERWHGFFPEGRVYR